MLQRSYSFLPGDAMKSTFGALSLGVDHVMVYVDQPNAKLPNASAFRIEHLKK